MKKEKNILTSCEGEAVAVAVVPHEGSHSVREPFFLPEFRQEGRATLTLLRKSGPLAPSTLLGMNLEMAVGSSNALLSNRLENPKFCGPPNENTGLALGWQPLGANMGQVHNSLVRGMFLSGHESQLVNSYAEPWAGIVQIGRCIYAGEDLEVEIWAKSRHHPVTLTISLRPLASRADPYCEADVIIDAAYWKCYKIHFRAPCEDRETCLFIVFKTIGVVLFDQIHLRPVGEPTVSKKVMEMIEDLKLSTLRFPGGCTSTNYHWRLGLGPSHLRPSIPDPVFKERSDYAFGTDEYLTMCQEFGIQPFITINIGSGTPSDAGDWAKYCAEWYKSRSLALPEIYFQMGNEHYGVWESAHMNADMYVQALGEYVPVIRANYPRATVIGLGEPFCSGAGAEPKSELRNRVLAEAGHLIDIIGINRYKGQWYSTAEKQMFNAAESVNKIRGDLVELIEDCRRHRFPPRVALPEWNYWLHASHWDGKGFFEPDDVQHGLFVSGMFHMFARLAPELEVAAFEQLINPMGIIRNDGGKVSETAIGELFRLYRPAFPAEVLPFKIDSPELQDGIDQVDAVALRQDKKLWIFAANRSHDKALTLSLDGFQFKKSTSRLFVASDYSSPLKERPAAAVKDAVELPPLSLVRICFED